MKNLDTVWTSQAADGQTLKEYPRPGMVRGRWIQPERNVGLSDHGQPHPALAVL